MKKLFFLAAVLVFMSAFTLSPVSAQQMGPGMMGPGYGQQQQQGNWDYCPYCGGYLGQGRGYGMGPGMMGRGYGMGPGMMGPGYGYGSPYRQTPMDKNDAEKFMQDYLRSTGNPNLKLGEIQDKGNFFEAEIKTKNGDLVDKMTLDKRTGWIGSAMTGQGYGMGPGMMGRGYGMGPGMMGRGYGMGYGMGPGMMGRGYGMMGPGYYGSPTAPGYQGPQYRQPKEPLKQKDARELLTNYLQSTRNPNLKLGKIEDKGDSFEAEIQTKNGDLVDKITIDKETGWMHSAY